MGQLTRQSTSKFILNDKNFYRLEKNLVSFSGMPTEFIKIINVKVGTFQNETVYIKTIAVGSFHQRNPILVFVHGFAGSGALFYKVFKDLVQYFNIYFVDIIGMGGSSRPSDFDRVKFNAEDCIDYYVSYLEKWRE